VGKLRKQASAGASAKRGPTPGFIAGGGVDDIGMATRPRALLHTMWARARARARLLPMFSV
jgi:hypothetical protein